MFRKLKTNYIAKLIALPLLILVLFTLSGCANVTYLEYATDSTYNLEINITLDEDAGKGQISKQAIFENNILILNQYQTSIKNQFYNNLDTLLANHEISYDNYYAIYCANAVETTIELDAPNFSVTLITVFKNVKTNMTEFLYSDIISIYSRGTLNKEDSTPIEIKENFLTINTIQKSENPFNSTDCAYLGEQILNGMGLTSGMSLYSYADDGYTLKDVSYIYEYGTQARRLHTDADEIFYDGTLYYNCWYVDQDDNGLIVNSECTFYRTYINAVNWYYIGFGVAFVALGVIAVICYNYYKRKNALKVSKMLNIE